MPLRSPTFNCSLPRYRVNRKGNASEDHLIDYATDPKNLADSLASSIQSYTQRLAHRQILKRYPE